MVKSSYTASLEDYLEAIYIVSREKTSVRVTELAERLKVRKASVSEAILKLSKKNLIKHERYGTVKLTPKGRKVAEDVYQRHEVFRRFLEEILGVDGKTAEEDACMLEHAVSRQTLKKLVKFVEEQMKIRKISPG
ncbi:MAG: metal-dependent transcriptional regulator [Candidatus Hecatellales archaeon]|nr:MAG: metal-dependent transcriptional regulator [Candidatus Hecatellales archaeon]